MDTKIFANRFGLATAAIILSLVFSTAAFAGNNSQPSGPQQVVVTNTAAQPLPMVGLITDSDAPARKPLQTVLMNISVPAGGATFKAVSTVSANQRLVIEHVSGNCAYIAGYVALESKNAGSVTGFEYLSSDIFSKVVSAPVKFYANPGDEFGILVNNVGAQGGYCGITVTGYYVNLP